MKTEKTFVCIELKREALRRMYPYLRFEDKDER